MTATPQESSSARRYRIERYLTEGGMGAIYVGKKLGPGGFEKEVVLKQLLPEYTARPEFRDLFFREAKISATLDHANIVHTFDLVESEESLFIVMEYVRGVDLRTIIRRAKLRRRELAPAAALHIALEILAGLAYAHNRKTPGGASMAIIHRDVSPSNVLCSAQGEVKLSDFGIAKAATHSSVFYRVRGKVGYMSPEQARNQPIDHRTDLYSVAVCLYEALTAERLFVGDLSTPADVIYSQPIVPPSKKRKGLPTALDVVLATALANDPGDRYQDAVAFAEALRQVGHRHGLLFSAPQLAEHLRFILGRDPSSWLAEDRPAASGGDPSTQKIPARELEGKEASSIGVVIDGSNLYVVDGGDVVSPRADAVSGGSVKSDLRRKLGLPPEADDEDVDFGDDTTRRAGDPDDELAEGDETTRRLPDPEAAAQDAFVSVADEEDDEVPTRIRDRAVPGMTPPPVTPPPPVTGPPPRRRPSTIPPPPPAHAFAPVLPPESPFDDYQATPGPGPALFGGVEIAPPTPGPEEVFASPGQGFAPMAFAPTSFAAPAVPQPARPPGGLPRPGGYLDPNLGANLRMPPAPRMPTAPHPVAFDGSGGYGGGGPAPFGSGSFAPETIDFGRDSAAVSARRSGPPGLLMLFLGLLAAGGGAWVGEKVTHNDVAALEAAVAAQPAPAARPKATHRQE
jgi:serine/threonine protein kinase